MPKPTAEIIAAAIDGYEFQKTRIHAKIVELRALLSGSPSEPATTSKPPKRKRRKMSPTGRRAIAEAQRKRWAASKKAAEASAPVKAEPPKPKRRVSKAGMARIIAPTKKRWARVRAAKAQQEKTVAKKTAVRKAV